MKILVTGKNGQLGSEINKIYPKYNYNWVFTGHDNFDLSDLKNINVSLDTINPNLIGLLKTTESDDGFHMDHTLSYENKYNSKAQLLKGYISYSYEKDDVHETGEMDSNYGANFSGNTTTANENNNNLTASIDYENELVISVDSFKDELKENINALVIRTNPNGLDKVNRNYGDYSASFLTHDSIDYILDSGVKHLLVDLPSIDKADDGGQLGNHHRFFKLGKTISELLYIPDPVQDGIGFLQIQIPNWGLDAAPSRPIFYPV